MRFMFHKFFVSAVFLGLLSLELHAADRDDLYAEIVAAYGLNQPGRHRLGAVIGFCPRDEIGIGFVAEQHRSTHFSSADLSGLRGALEFRWFQEPFEFSADLGLMRRVYQDSTRKMQVSVGVTTAYLWALTPSLAAKLDFSFLFLDEPRVIFSGGVGARVLF
jgi:hypothetical protein